MLKWIGAVLFVGLVASAAYFLLGDRYTPPQKTTHGKPVHVKVTTVVKKDLKEELPVTITVRSPVGIMIKAEAEGRITQIFVASSEEVAKDQPLMTINPYPLKAQLQVNKSRLTLARKNLVRAEELVKQDYISKEEYDEANEAFHENASRVKRTEALLDLTLIRAPFEGRLGLRRVELGDYVKKGQDLIGVLNPALIRVDFSVPQNYLKEIFIGQEVALRCDALPDITLLAHVYATEAAVDVENRALRVRAHVKDPPKELIPGIFCQGLLVLADARQVLMVPQTAVSYSVSGSFVYKVVDGKAVKAPVRIGRRKGNQVVIVSGLKAGELVVSEGRVKVGDGSLVTYNGLPHGRD